MLISRGGISGIIFCHQTGGPITGWLRLFTLQIIQEVVNIE